MYLYLLLYKIAILYFIFCGICRRQCHFEFHMIFWKSCIVFSAKLKEVDPINPFPRNDTFWCPWERSLLKTLGEKEKLLAMSNFSFSHSVFFWFEWHLLMPLGKKPFENTGGKGEIARNEQFLLFPQCFLLVWITFCHFPKILNCRLQSL